MRVVCTTGMIAEIIREVGGERVGCRALMAPGVDPHSYKATLQDVQWLKEAELVFYNGWLLEGRMTSVLEALSKQGKRVVALAERLPIERLIALDAKGKLYDPHVWHDVSLWCEGIAVVEQVLTEVDPEGALYYRQRAEELAERWKQLDAWCREQAARVPKEQRVLVTSHDAFHYFGKAYDFKVVGLQGISTVSEASLADIVRLVRWINEQRVPAIFVESSVNPSGIRRVAKEAGVTIGGELFSDALGARGERRRGYEVDRYEGMMRYNMETIVEALTKPRS
ncbi:MAG: zinc ABC transporter substrate-binding protein [Methylacidiphilales bacterium]|nr:zinc ABC transporter substrate-binding protein [Candidatus Methylacidiphilales bacterium]MDW8349350.1 zinc ABC transporter substrate-binding protein [Verrucomicrobiae bacterium]